MWKLEVCVRWFIDQMMGVFHMETWMLIALVAKDNLYKQWATSMCKNTCLFAQVLVTL